MIEALSRVGGIGRRFDAWYNGVTGYGTERDKTTYGVPVSKPVLDQESLAALYNSNDMAARMVDVVPDEVYREGFNIETGDPELDEIIEDKFDALEVSDRFADGMRWGRCFGAGAVLIGANDGRASSEPLAIEEAEDIRYLHDLDRRSMFPSSYYLDFGNPKLGQPETYIVRNEMSGNQQIVHESRLILFGGATTARRERQQNQGWDYSILQRADEVIRSFDTGWKSVEVMLTDANQAVMKISNLADIVAAPDGASLIAKRAQLMDMYRSVIRALVVDADTNEGLERQSVSFADIPNTLDKLMLRLAACAEMPVTILMGQSPAGMNATGESDLRWFYGRLESQRTRKQSPRVRHLTRLWLRTEVGRRFAPQMPAKIGIKWPSLWSEPPSVEAQRRKTIAETDAAHINAQVYTPEEVALVRGRADGWEKSVVLDEKAIAARESALAMDLEGFSQPAPETTTEEEI